MSHRSWFSTTSVLICLCILFWMSLSVASSEFRHGQKSLGSNKTDESRGIAVREGRTFGRIKRLQFALLPIMYKLGVMSTLLVVLTAISLKGLLIGVTLLMINISALMAKFAVWIHSSKSHNSGGWSEEPSASGHKDVHVHIHNTGHQEHSAYGHYERSDPYATAAYEDPYYDPYYRRRTDPIYWRGRPINPPSAMQENPGLIGTIMNSIGAYSNQPNI